MKISYLKQIKKRIREGILQDMLRQTRWIYVKLSENVHWIGVDNPELRVFDIIMETKMGTTYNSFLIEDEKITIVRLEWCRSGR